MAYKKKIAPIIEKKEVPKAEKRALGLLKVRMCCKDEKHEWNFKAKSSFDAVLEGQRICKENGFKFPQDVIVWDFS